MQYRFLFSVFSKDDGHLFDSEMDAGSIKEVAKYHLGRHITTEFCGTERKERITRIEIHSQIPLTEG